MIKQYGRVSDAYLLKIQNCLEAISVNPTDVRLSALQNALNEAFSSCNCKCKGVIYTKNIDKPFFGMCIMPIITGTNATKILANEDVQITEYYLEFDSKLLEIGLTPEELTAVLLHELGHIVLSMDQSLEYVKNATSVYFAKNREVLKLRDAIKHTDILAFGITDALRRINSIFSDQEYKADSYAIMLGYGKALESALGKISARSINLNKDLDNKLLALQWSLRLYKNIKLRRVPAVRALNRMAAVTGSQLEKKSINRCMSSVDDNMRKITNVFYESVLMETKNQLSIFRKLKNKSMRGVEDDLYEYKLRVKSVDEQDEALLILRDINSRLAIIDDFLSDPDLDKMEKERWMGVRKEYILLRQELSKKTTYDDKYYGLFIKTPVVKSRYEI